MNKEKDINTKDEAIDYAKEWQQWASEQSLSSSELVVWKIEFEKLAKRFDLLEEFKENGII